MSDRGKSMGPHGGNRPPPVVLAAKRRRQDPIAAVPIDFPLVGWRTSGCRKRSMRG